MDDRIDLGARIRQLRGRLLSQRELADNAQVSVDLIRKLEQGRRHTASIGSLHRIATALDVTVADLLGKPARLPSDDPEAGVVAIRRALTPVDDLLDTDVIESSPLNVDEADRTVTYIWGTYWSGRYELLSKLLPNALMQLRATYQSVPANQKHLAVHALVRAYQAAGDTLVHLGHQDAAFLAIREALRMANECDDALLHAAIRLSISWQLLVQGRYEESEQVAVVASRDFEPHGNVSDSDLSAYGILTITAATAAARAQKSSALDLLNVADEAAGRIGYERSDLQTTFGPAKVAMLAVDVHVAQDEFSSALAAAKAVPRDASLPLASRARHLADLALAHLRLGHDAQAINSLLTMEQIAPEWIKYQTLPKQIVADLLERERPTRLRELAMRIGAVAG